MRQYARVRMTKEWFEEPLLSQYTKFYPFYHHFRNEESFNPILDDFLYFLGEIPNMPGHCILISSRGQIYAGYHTDSFEEIPEDEC